MMLHELGNDKSHLRAPINGPVEEDDGNLLGSPLHSL
ncbi:hypothetical protein C5167_037671 [Papaver somniferum]|uniref:Uncharacterized protein n=1 Tax=Papaver somniferum TaxID=3469 RepID=A0A4Y7I9K5_PAPSO|nr:hypothetical protein C5167_037671 [Papaver somniferum]